MMIGVSKILIFIGAGLIVLGIALPLLTKAGFGKFPGDILIKKGDFTFYFPLTTCILLSLLISFIFKLFQR